MSLHLDKRVYIISNTIFFIVMYLIIVITVILIEDNCIQIESLIKSKYDYSAL